MLLVSGGLSKQLQDFSQWDSSARHSGQGGLATSKIKPASQFGGSAWTLVDTFPCIKLPESTKQTARFQALDSCLTRLSSRLGLELALATSVRFVLWKPERNFAAMGA